jgi:hypothetical protein
MKFDSHKSQAISSCSVGTTMMAGRALRKFGCSCTSKRIPDAVERSFAAQTNYKGGVQ